MRILKKLLIVLCLSFIFVVNAYALTNFTTHNLQSLDNYLSNNPNKTETDYVNMIFENIDLPSEEYLGENYIFTIDTTYAFVTLRYVSSSDLIHVAYNNNYGNPYLSFRSDITSNYNYCSKTIQFTSQGNYSSSNNWSCGHNSSYTDTFFARNYNYYIIASNYEYMSYKSPTWGQDSFSIDNGTQYQFNTDNIPINFTNGNLYNFEVIDLFGSQEPTYTLEQTILEDGRVKLLFNFTNYDTNNNYAFTITNKVNGEEYGIPNLYVSIFPNIIPFGSSYEIILDYDTVITVSLSQYIPIEGTDLYDREPLYVDSYDINNVVFNDLQSPYFSIIFQNKNNLIGIFNNINNNNSCFYKFSTDNVETNVSCNDTLDLQLLVNGYVDVIIKRQNNIVYQRKINILGGSETEPYIVYNLEKQDFYSKINWYVENYNNQLKYRYSINNGLNFSSWENLTSNEQFLNVYQNSTVIIEIANSTDDSVYDSKAINVIVSIENLNNFNNTTNNLIDKFNNIFNVNGNILMNIETFWSTLKTTKLYLFVFIPFITSIICAIIYLIRRK